MEAKEFCHKKQYGYQIIKCEKQCDDCKPRSVILMAEPIQLTEEWLLENGFVYNNNSQYNIGENPLTKDYLLSLCWIDGEEFLFYRNGYFKIKDVNQLQTLYFALTNKELEIKKQELEILKP